MNVWHSLVVWSMHLQLSLYNYIFIINCKIVFTFRAAGLVGVLAGVFFVVALTLGFFAAAFFTGDLAATAFGFFALGNFFGLAPSAFFVVFFATFVLVFSASAAFFSFAFSYKSCKMFCVNEVKICYIYQKNDSLYIVITIIRFFRSQMQGRDMNVHVV